MANENSSAGFWILPALGLGVSLLVWQARKNRPARVFGVVTDSGTGLPIADVAVALTPLQPVGEVTMGVVTDTDVDGYYEMAGIDPGDYTLALAKEGFNSVFGQAILVAGDNELNIQMEPL